LIYLIQAVVWLPLFLDPVWSNSIHLAEMENVFFVIVTVFISINFVALGGRLFLKLKSFPIESEGRNKVLWEVGLVTIICFGSFLIRAGFLIAVTVDKLIDLDPIVILLYHIFVEIMPMIALLFILTRPSLDPKANIEFEDSNTFSDREDADQVDLSLEEEKSNSGNTMPNSKLYYASNPRSYHWARLLDSGSLPTVHFAVSYPNPSENLNENSHLLWEVDENYVDKSSITKGVQ